MSRFDLILFDCDGVLIDSEALGAQANSEAMTAAGWPMTPLQAENIFSGAGGEEALGIIRARGLPAEVVVRDASQRLSALFAQGVNPIQGMEALIQGLNVNICVASNSSVARLKESLGRTPLAALFAPFIFSADHVARGKPAPDLALFCLDQMRCTPGRALFIDDNTHGIRCARDAGIVSVGFIGPSDHRPNQAETLLKAGADYVVRGADELTALLNDLLVSEAVA